SILKSEVRRTNRKDLVEARGRPNVPRGTISPCCRSGMPQADLWVGRTDADEVWERLPLPDSQDGKIELRQLFGLENFGLPGHRPKQRDRGEHHGNEGRSACEAVRGQGSGGRHRAREAERW